MSFELIFLCVIFHFKNSLKRLHFSSTDDCIYYSENSQCPTAIMMSSLGLNRDQETDPSEAQIFVSALYYSDSNSST